jgi:hypothetical protein
LISLSCRFEREHRLETAETVGTSHRGDPGFHAGDQDLIIAVGARVLRMTQYYSLGTIAGLAV